MSHVHTASGKEIMSGSLPPTSLDPATDGEISVEIKEQIRAELVESFGMKAK